jgi:hypothetical protein
LSNTCFVRPYCDEQQAAYRATNTPTSETLNNLTVCNGFSRIVYAAPATDYNIYSFTFQPPSSTQNEIEDLIDLVKSFNLPAGTENSLTTKLQNARAAIAANNIPATCDWLSSFINECQAQSGKKLTEAQASQLISTASAIKTQLGCP